MIGLLIYFLQKFHNLYRKLDEKLVVVSLKKSFTADSTLVSVKAIQGTQLL